MKRKTKMLSIFLILILVVSLAAGCTKSTTEKATLTKDTDIVVIGGGTSGLCAAIEAASQGKKVIVLEKQGVLGGSGIFAEGVFATDSSVQKSLDIEVDSNEVVRMLLDESHYKVDTKLWEQVIDRSAANIEWLQSLGVNFLGVDSIGVGVKAWHIYDGYGASVTKAMAAKAEELGIEVMLNTPGKELIMENGKVAGVKAMSKDQEVIINAKAVIIATGGFAADVEMTAEKIGIDVSKINYIGPPGNTGDGIIMAEKVGATSQGSPIVVAWPGAAGYSITSQLNEAAAMEPTNLWVNQNGERFVNEDITLHPTTASNAVAVPQATYSIMDSDSVKRLTEQGCIVGAGAYVPRGSTLDKFNEEVQAALDKKSTDVVKADTIDQLADQLGLDKAALTATIDKYNEDCASGVDTAYGKATPFMAPVKTGPFYGFRLKVSVVSSMGGLKVNEKNEVLNSEQQVIPGLYAAGMDIDGFEGDTYTMEVPGSQQAISQITGKNAGKNAVDYISN